MSACQGTKGLMTHEAGRVFEAANSFCELADVFSYSSKVAFIYVEMLHESAI